MCINPAVVWWAWQGKFTKAYNKTNRALATESYLNAETKIKFDKLGTVEVLTADKLFTPWICKDNYHFLKK